MSFYTQQKSKFIAVIIRGSELHNLPHQVKTQYLQIENIVDTSIKYQISGKSTTVVKGCMYIWLIL